MDVPAAVVAYDLRWPDQFLQLRDRVDAALGDVTHVTEHVGSTAVPGLDAKPTDRPAYNDGKAEMIRDLLRQARR